MTQIRRRDLLLTGRSLAGMVGALHAGTLAGDSSVKPKRFEETAGFDLADVVSQFRLAILPLGNLEFHGPHIPLGSDSIIISGIAERVAARTPALLFPTIRFSQCPPHTAQFRGTISVVCKLVGVSAGRHDEDPGYVPSGEWRAWARRSAGTFCRRGRFAQIWSICSRCKTCRWHQTFLAGRPTFLKSPRPQAGRGIPER